MHISITHSVGYKLIAWQDSNPRKSKLFSLPMSVPVLGPAYSSVYTTGTRSKGDCSPPSSAWG
jgi:hypothetical protein